MKEILNNILLLVAVIDPLGTIPVFLEATKQFNKFEKRKIAINSSIIAFFVLLFFIIVGQLILEGMDITIEAFQISGGVILFLFALTMIFGEGKPNSEKKLITDYKHVTVFPVAIPSIASPGAIMGVVLLTDNHTYSLPQQIITSSLILVVISITCILLISSYAIQKRVGEIGITIISKIMGLILAAYGAQNILSGIKNYFLQ